jgi:hypothetical protein
MTSTIYSSSRKKGYDVVDPTHLFVYYTFDASTVIGTSVGNMATGSLVYDGTLVSPNTTIVNNKMKTVAFGLYGTLINKIIPCSTSTGLSISLRFNITSIPNQNYYFLFTIQDVKGYAGGGKRIYYTIDPQNRININNQLIVSTPLIVNKDYHLVVTVTPGNLGKIYVNNILIITGSLSYPSFINASGYNSIGRDPAGAGLIGTIDEFRLYNRILTANEVNVLSYQ